MRSGTINNVTKWSKSWGGTRKCYESKPTLIPGGFNFKLEELPLSGNVLPAGTPVNADEEKLALAETILKEISSAWREACDTPKEHTPLQVRS